MILCEFTMFPTDKGISVSPWVARILDIVDASGIPYRLTPMGTILEGKWEDITGLIGRCLAALEDDCDRINISIKMDYRRGDEIRMDAKVEKIEQLLGRTLR